MSFFDLFRKKRKLVRVNSISNGEQTKKPNVSSSPIVEEVKEIKPNIAFEETKALTSTEISKEKTEELYCPKCGTKLIDGFCPKCGEIINKQENINKEFLERDKKENVVTYEYKFKNNDSKATVTVTTSVHEPSNPFDYPYNESYAYQKFMDKYRYIDSPEHRDPLNYVYREFLDAGVKNVKGVRKIHEELFEKGLYKVSNDPISYLKNLKSSELRELAKKLNLQIKGKKDDFINQIKASVDYNTLKNIFDYDMYEFSEKVFDYGGIFIDLKREYNNSLADKSISFLDFIKLRETTSVDELNYRYYKKINDTKRLANYDKNKKNECVQESKELLKTLYIELSGTIYNVENWKEFKKIRLKPENRRDVPIKFNYNLVNSIKANAEYINDEMITKATTKKLVFTACPPELFKNIIKLIIEDKFDRETKKKIEEALNNNLSTIRNNLYGF